MSAFIFSLFSLSTKTIRKKIYINRNITMSSNNLRSPRSSPSQDATPFAIEAGELLLVYFNFLFALCQKSNGLRLKILRNFNCILYRFYEYKQTIILRLDINVNMLVDVFIHA